MNKIQINEKMIEKTKTNYLTKNEKTTQKLTDY